MGEVVSFKKKVEPIPIPQVIEAAFEDIDAGWSKAASSNRLNEYFMQGIPAWADHAATYPADLNAIAEVERKININFTVRSPGTELGWVAVFKLKESEIETPFMLSEAYARCFNVLLFLKVKRDLQAQGYDLDD